MYRIFPYIYHHLPPVTMARFVGRYSIAPWFAWPENFNEFRKTFQGSRKNWASKRKHIHPWYREEPIEICGDVSQLSIYQKILIYIYIYILIYWTQQQGERISCQFSGSKAGLAQTLKFKDLTNEQPYHTCRRIEDVCICVCVKITTSII